MGYEQDPNRATRNMKFKARPTTDKVPEDFCRVCKKRVRFGTDGSGHCVAFDADTLERHPCVGA